jgi:endonuclease/exonuclease/phosphatase family metal-dependent hydrolase
MYKENKFDVLESGQFWLSDTPDAAGSKSTFDPSMPRICTWAKFRAKDNTRAVFYYFNTHLSTVSPAAKQGAAIILDRISKIVTSNEIPVFIGGDFNGDRISTTYNSMKLSDFKDTWTESGKPFKDDGTSHQWTGKTDLGGQHIDWIFHRNALKVNSIEINHYNENGFYPSDHYPVQLDVDISLADGKSWFDKFLKR